MQLYPRGATFHAVERHPWTTGRDKETSVRNVEKTVGPRVLECLRAGEERRKEKLETRDGDSCEVRRKRVQTREREKGKVHGEKGRGDRKAVRTMDKEGTRLEKRRLMH